jgi:hypothetical protein
MRWCRVIPSHSGLFPFTWCLFSFAVTLFPFTLYLIPFNYCLFPFTQLFPQKYPQTKCVGANWFCFRYAAVEENEANLIYVGNSLSLWFILLHLAFILLRRHFIPLHSLFNPLQLMFIPIHPVIPTKTPPNGVRGG